MYGVQSSFLLSSCTFCNEAVVGEIISVHVSTFCGRTASISIGVSKTVMFVIRPTTYPVCFPFFHE